MSSAISICVLSSRSLAHDIDFTTTLQLLCRSGDQLRPQRCGYDGNLTQSFDCSRPEAALNYRRTSFQWERSNPAARGAIEVPLPEYAPQHGRVEAEVDPARADVPRLVQFLQDACSTLDADFGLIHLPVADEWQGPGRPSLYHRSGTGVYLNTGTLEENIPEMPWAAVFGPPYVELFGRRRLLTAPAHAVAELTYGGIYVQLTGSPLDFETKYTLGPSLARMALKAHLGSDAFYNNDLAFDHEYNVPRFRLPEVAEEALALRRSPGYKPGGAIGEVLAMLQAVEGKNNPPFKWKMAKQVPVRIPVEVPVRCQQRIRAVRWFQHCGRQWPSGGAPVRCLTSWRDAESGLGRFTRGVKTAADNSLRQWLHVHYPRAFQKLWAPLAAVATSFTERAVAPGVWAYAAEKQLTAAVPASLRGDLVGYVLEEALDPLQHPSRFYRRLMEIYEAGHFPCGWEGGEWPEGRLLVY